MIILKIFGWLSILFGVLVILLPQLLGWLVGGFFIIIGINLIAFGWNVKRIR